MSVARATEISAESDQSFDDAVAQGVARAVKTLKNVRSAWIKDQQVTVEGDRVTQFRVAMKVTFILDDV